MFTGIVEETGCVEKIEKKKNLCVLRVRAPKIIKGTKLGDSIAVNGVCLTVTSIKSSTFIFDVMKESLALTTLGHLKEKSSVNLERSLKADSRLGGHFVTGHVDCMGEIVKRVQQPNYLKLEIKIFAHLIRYIVPKGSVTVNGVSLTVGKVKSNGFDVFIIPFTENYTNLGALKKGERVNIETDILAKYVLNERKKRWN